LFCDEFTVVPSHKVTTQLLYVISAWHRYQSDVRKRSR
jgi:hypothetical protein